jgi:hypothetical protein
MVNYTGLRKTSKSRRLETKVSESMHRSAGCVPRSLLRLVGRTVQDLQTRYPNRSVVVPTVSTKFGRIPKRTAYDAICMC